MKLNHSGRPMTLNEHIFNWFNERYPDQMAECLAAYTDSEPPFDTACPDCGGQGIDSDMLGNPAEPCVRCKATGRVALESK